MGRGEAQGFPGLVQAHWCVEPGPGNVGCMALRVLELVFQLAGRLDWGPEYHGMVPTH